MRTASPGLTVPENPCPAALSPTIRSTPGASELRTAHPDLTAFRRAYRLPDADFDAFLTLASVTRATAEKPAAAWRTDLAAQRPVLDAILRGRVASRLYGRDSGTLVYNEIDGVLRAALTRWSEAEALAAHPR